MSDRWENVLVDDQAMRAFTAVPDGSGPFPGMVVIQGWAGVDTFVQETTSRLAAAGYFGIAPELYKRQDLNDGADNATRSGRLADPEIIQDVTAAADFLQGNGAVNRDRVGIMGFCLGGRVVYLTATAVPAFKGAVPYYGAGTMVARGEGPPVFERLAKTVCPVLGFFGGEDANPSPEDMKKLDAEYTKHGIVHEFHSYPGAGHAYMDYTTSRYNKEASEASWPITLAFLEKYLS